MQSLLREVGLNRFPLHHRILYLSDLFLHAFRVVPVLLEQAYSKLCRRLILCPFRLCPGLGFKRVCTVADLEFNRVYLVAKESPVFI